MEKRKVKNMETIKVALANNGGFVATLKKSK
jgi:hypothetical protein